MSPHSLFSEQNRANLLGAGPSWALLLGSRSPTGPVSGCLHHQGLLNLGSAPLHPLRTSWLHVWGSLCSPTPWSTPGARATPPPATPPPPRLCLQKPPTWPLKLGAGALAVVPASPGLPSVSSCLGFLGSAPGHSASQPPTPKLHPEPLDPQPPSTPTLQDLSPGDFHLLVFCYARNSC